MKKIALLWAAVVLFIGNCTIDNKYNYTKVPIDQYIVGTWLQDSTNKKLHPQKHKSIRIVEYLPNNKGVSYFYSFRHNKVYMYNFDGYELSDTSLIFKDSDDIVSPPNWDHYRLVRMGPDNFKLIAEFAVSGWSFPDHDSIIYYSRINNADDYLDSLMKIEKPIGITCPHPDLTQLHGYWKEDSTEEINFTSIAKYDYIFIDTAGTYHNLWLGRNPHHQQNNFVIKDNELIFEDGNMPIKCLDQDHLIFELISENDYSAIYYSRIKPDKIIPDSLRIDKK